MNGRFYDPRAAIPIRKALDKPAGALQRAMFTQECGNSLSRTTIMMAVTFVAANFSTPLGAKERSLMTGLDQVTVEIRTFPVRRVAAVRHQGAYQNIGAAFERVVSWAKAHNLLRAGVEVIGIFHDDPDKQPSELLRSDACLTLTENVVVDGEVQLLTIEGGPYAVATHYGPYTGLPSVYRHLYGDWMESSGHRPRPLPCFEIYRNDCSDTKPEDLITEVCVPIL